MRGRKRTLTDSEIKRNRSEVSSKWNKWNDHRHHHKFIKYEKRLRKDGNMLGLPINNNQALPWVPSIQRQRSNWSRLTPSYVAKDTKKTQNYRYQNYCPDDNIQIYSYGLLCEQSWACALFRNNKPTANDHRHHHKFIKYEKRLRKDGNMLGLPINNNQAKSLPLQREIWRVALPWVRSIQRQRSIQIYSYGLLYVNTSWACALFRNNKQHVVLGQKRNCQRVEKKRT
jgi:hypothetical protein